MGWTVQFTDRRGLIADILRGMNWTNEKAGSISVVAHCLVGNNLWSVLERKTLALKDENGNEKPAETYRFIVLHLIRRYGRDEWGYKDMDEDCGPYELSCPESYLDLAPATSHLGENSKAWREAVRKHWAKRRAAQKFAKTLKPGDRFMWGGREIRFEGFQGKHDVIGSSVKGTFRYPRHSIGPMDGSLQEHRPVYPNEVATFTKEVPAGSIVVPSVVTA